MTIRNKYKYFSKLHSRNTDLLSDKYFIRPSTVSIVEDPILCLLLIPSKCCNYINTVIQKYMIITQKY